MNRWYVFATQEEYDNLREYVPKNERVIITGEGYANVIRSLKDLDEDENVIINIGYCGSNNLPVGTVVRVKNCYSYHPIFGDSMKYKDKSYLCDPAGRYDCYSSGDFVVQTDIKEPCVFDMELYAICSLGFKTIAIKIVSDNLSLHDYDKVSKGE